MKFSDLNQHHFLYPILGVIVLFAGLAWLRAHDAWKDMQARIAVDAEKIKQNAEKGTQAQHQVEAGTRTIVQTDQATKQKVDELQRRLQNIPTSAEIAGIVKQALPPGASVEQATTPEGKKVLQIEDTAENRAAINKVDVDLRTCQLNLFGCQAARDQYEKVIVPNLKTQIETLTATNQILEDQNKKLKSFGKGGNFWGRTGRVAIPIACAGGGAYLAGRFKAGQTNQGRAAATGAIVAGGVCAFTFHF